MADAKKAETEGEAPAPKKKGKLILFIAIGVLVLVLGGGGAAYVLMKKKPVDETADGEDPAAEVKAKKKKADHNSAPSFYKFDKPFTVKLQTEQQEAYLQADMQMRVLDPAALEMLKQYDPELKHRIMLILLTKKASDLGTAPGVQRLSNEIREVVNNTLEPPVAKKNKEKVEAQEPGDVVSPSAPVQAVLFTSFIIQ